MSDALGRIYEEGDELEGQGESLGEGLAEP